MRIISPAAAAMAAMVAFVLTAVPTSTLAASGTVTGMLLDEEGQGVSGLPVGACGPAGCVKGQAESAEGGHFTLTLPAGSDWNVFSGDFTDCSRYAFAHKFGVNVPEGGSVSVDLRLARQWGTISGRVLDQNGSPVAGVGLLVDNAETGGFGMSYAISAADGTYSAGCLAASGVAGSGAYFITAGPPAGSPYGGQQDSGVRVFPERTTLHDVVLHAAGGNIAGHVRCNGGPCPAGTTILIYCEGCTSSANGSVAADGGYALGHLASGQKYDVHAVAPAGWDKAIRYGVAVHDGAQTRVDFNLLPSGSASSGRLTGRITDAFGGAHGQCLINAFGGVPGTSSGGWTDGDVFTGPDGTYDTGFDLVPGDYQVFVVCPGLAQVQPTAGRAVRVNAGMATDASYTFSAGSAAASVSSLTDAVPATQAFFAAGATSFSSSLRTRESILVSNPGAAQVLTVTYLFSGVSPLIRHYPLPAQGSVSISVNGDAGANHEVSAWLSAAAPFAAERSLAIQTADGVNSGTDVIGASALRDAWFFAEGSTAPGFSESLVLMNPNQGQDASAQVIYALANGQSKRVSHRVASMGRTTITVNDPAEAGSSPAVAISVFADVPIVAERQMLFHYRSVSGARDALGTSQPTLSVSLPPAHVGDGVDAFLAVFNPDDDDAHVQLTYITADGVTVSQALTVAGASRTTIKINDAVVRAADYAVEIQADLPIIAERSSYAAT